ncbi:MAG: malto-oligosyltrehalose trehalohydrolase [Polyangiaceae bacterium]
MQPASRGNLESVMRLARTDPSLDVEGSPLARRLPIGCEVSARGAHFRLWSPSCSKVEVVIEGATPMTLELTSEPGGYFSGIARGVRTGDRYRFRLDGDEKLLPDPASRFQPDGPHGASEIVDPSTFEWTDWDWPGVGRLGQVLYEMHIGTFTREGTWEAAMRELPELARLGVTILEIMPLAEFPGAFGWGYDGVDWFAPTRLYGRPDDVRRFIDRAHALGLGVILDVVYNHFGPDGNYITRFAKDFVSDHHGTEWGAAINYDGQNSFGVREFVVTNARYWIEEFHFDGLRFDATQSIFDASDTHILCEIATAVREAAAPRTTFLVAENEQQEGRLLRPCTSGGYSLDAAWNDDYHHAARVALTGFREAYYEDYAGAPQEIVSALKWGYLFQGQFYRWQKKRRGTAALDLDPAAFTVFLQNHDQVANSGDGRRIHALTTPAKFRAMTALTLLGPGTPLLFQGQEFAASAPFLYFADHEADLAKLVREGRRAFLTQFPSLASPDVQAKIADPSARSTFDACKLDFSERESHAATYALHRDLLALRRRDPVFRAGQVRGGVDGFVLNEHAFGIRLFGGDSGDRLLLVNLGDRLELGSVADPLFAPPDGATWQTSFSSSDVIYGGDGARPTESERGFTLPAECTVVLSPTESGGLP